MLKMMLKISMGQIIRWLPDQVARRSWVGARMMGEMRTPSHWNAAASNSTAVELQPLQIKIF